MASATIPRNDSSPLVCLDSKPSFKAQVLLPGDNDYRLSEESYWSNTAKIGPACIVRPVSADEVADAVKVLVANKQPFAVRSGGHAPLATTNNIEGGVTVDLTLLNNIEYDVCSETISFGPGVRWKDVFTVLEPYKRVAAGGREGQTGVGGFLLGGGNAWVTARGGFACDNVVSFEVVLASGKIIIVKREGEHEDLFRALKGGWNNFGIVTRFSIKTFPNDGVWAGVTIYSTEHNDALIEATQRFTTNVPDYLNSSLITVFGHVEALKQNVVVTATVQTDGVEDSPAWADFRLPNIMDTRAKKTMLDMGLETALDAGQFTSWSTITIKNDQRIMKKAVEIHDGLLAELLEFIPEANFGTQLIFQPLPTVFAQRSLAAGGNVLGLERNKHDGLLVQINTMMKTPEQKQFAEPRVRVAFETLKDFARTIEGGLFDWVYINYAEATQDVIAGYGQENVRFMQFTAAKYDPHHVFQELCVGGFKVSPAE